MTSTSTHPTIGPNATRAGAKSLYAMLRLLAYSNIGPNRLHPVVIDRVDDIPDTAEPAGIFVWQGRQYIVSVQPMPGVPDRDVHDDLPF
jgi:hypothetical protein